MRALFIANIKLDENEGIFKKVYAQAKGLKKAVGNGILITKSEIGCKIFDLDSGKVDEQSCSVLSKALELINTCDISKVYIRHMVPSYRLIKLLKVAHKKKCIIYYEIPTYPYYAEQFRTSKRKHRAITKLTLDTIFWPFIYKNIDKLVVIKSNSKVKKYKKMIEITNGALVDNIVTKQYKNELKKCFSMVAVGTLYPYHGYDRVLQGLKLCNESINGTIIQFNIVGSSETIDELKKEADNLGLCHVKFHGVKTTEELNLLYDQFDVGLGCLALHRRNADIDTTIKIIEYYCRGTPVVTSGISPMDQYYKNFTIHVESSEEPIDIEKVYKEFYSIDIDEKKKISSIAKEKFSWDNIMMKLVQLD